VGALFFLLFIQCAESGGQSQQLYNTYCGSCHLNTGIGVGELIPSIVASTKFEENRDEVICQIRYGIKDETNPTVYTMPPNELLSETEITNILNYIRKEWHTDVDEFSLQEVKKTLSICNQN